MALEALTAANEAAAEKRRRPARPIPHPDDVERRYRSQLRALVRRITRQVQESVLPILKGSDYTQDAIVTRDQWSDRVTAELDRIAEEYASSSFTEQVRRLAATTVAQANEQTTAAFINSVRRAIGVDFRSVLSERAMAEYLNAAIAQNVGLIKSVPEDLLKGLRTTVLQGAMDGESITSISRQIQQQTGVADRRARFIARDQLAKISGQVTDRRQKQAGIQYWRWVDSDDERVGSDHRLAARRDIGFGPGVYPVGYEPPEGQPGNAKRPNCRCTRSPVFEWEVPQRKR